MRDPRAAIAAELRRMYGTWFDGMESADPDRSLSVVAPDIIHQSPSGEVFEGVEALRKALIAFHAAFSERVTWDLEVITCSDHEAEVQIREQAILCPRAGGPEVRIAGHHHAWLRRDTGGWRIHRDVSTLEDGTDPHPDRS
jgi:ketosteroid isomerase-like protein